MLPAMRLADQLAAFPLLSAALPAPHSAHVPAASIAYRRAGAKPGAPVLVLLHGIGSTSASWLRQLQVLPAQVTVLAWNAPGYPGSSSLADESPTADHYAARVWAWLDALQIEKLTLVGHSLGALMAAAATRAAPQRVERLFLLSPAAGYGLAAAEVRASKLRDRLHALDKLGPQGMADKRGAALLSPQADAEQVAFSKDVMAQIDPPGYAQAARMLSNGRLVEDLAHITCPIQVASGSLDSITPPAACRLVADAARTPLIDLGPVGHACPLEAADQVNALLGGGARA